MLILTKGPCRYATESREVAAKLQAEGYFVAFEVLAGPTSELVLSLDSEGELIVG